MNVVFEGQSTRYHRGSAVEELPLYMLYLEALFGARQDGALQQQSTNNKHQYSRKVTYMNCLRSQAWNLNASPTSATNVQPLSYTPMPHIPIELIQRVVDFLHGDMPSLMALSLVARAWLPRSRQHIFHELQLPKGHARLEVFKHLCLHPLSTIPIHHIRKLTLHKPPSSMPWKALFAELFSPAFTSEQSMPLIEALLYNVEEINVVGINASRHWPPFYDLARSGQLHNIRTLTLTRCTLCYYGDLRFVFNTMDAMESLTLDEVKTNYYRSSGRVDYTLPETLRRLYIRDKLGAKCYISVLLDLKHSTCLNLREVYVDIGASRSFIEDLQYFLQRSSGYGRGRRSCTLAVRGNDVTSSDLRIFVAETKRAGWELTLKGKLDMICRLFSLRGLRPADAIDACSSSNLKHVQVEDVLEFMNSDEQFLRVFMHFEQLLKLDPIFGSVKGVRVEIILGFPAVMLHGAGWDSSERMVFRGSYPQMLMDVMVEEMQELLPYCHGRGVLQVKKVYRPA
ncbi:hypothetical protein VNI00_014154 [Paramarasmius palmivorus]|uniref:F-box domain-containing protein n=1 Tax=Paramarasmius palmivorus TaxID=297713 RepID=A0AAW0BU20_9AGAR